MEVLLIKVKKKEESSFIKNLLKKLSIQFKTVNVDERPSASEVKQSVIDGQAAYKNGQTDQFKKIDRKDLWK